MCRKCRPLKAEITTETNDGAPIGNSVKWLATQISDFGGSETENVVAWVRRVDRVTQIHGVMDSVVLLAASSKFIKSARQWYEIQDGAVIESWVR